jgi:dTDP-4-dehydrorhamnose reductase
MQKQKVLIMGTSGFIGSQLANYFSTNYGVYGTYNEHAMQSNLYKTYKLDALINEDVKRLIKRISPDLIIDAHGIINLNYAEANQEQTLKINFDASMNVAENADKANCKYIYISSNLIFDGKKNTKYVEEDTPNPLNYYGKTKLMAEQAIRLMNRDYIIARSSALFGNGGEKRTPPIFINWIIEQLKAKKEVKVVTDQYFSPTYAESLAQFIIALYEKDGKGIFNIAGKDTLSRFDFVNKIATTFGLDNNLIIPIRSGELGSKVPQPMFSGLDISKVERFTSIQGLRIDDALNMFKKKMVG